MVGVKDSSALTDTVLGIHSETEFQVAVKYMQEI